MHLREDIVALQEDGQSESLDLTARRVLDVGQKGRVEREVGKLLIRELQKVKAVWFSFVLSEQSVQARAVRRQALPG